MEEFSVKTEGMCFGYDGLMNKANRTSSVYALEDTELFVLDNDGFDKSFLKSILRAEIDRKDFLKDRIPVFKDNEAKFFGLFKLIKTHVR